MSRTWHTHAIDLDGSLVKRDGTMPRTKYHHEGDAIVTAYVPAFVLDEGTLWNVNVRNVRLTFDYEGIGSEGDVIDWKANGGEATVPTTRMITEDREAKAPRGDVITKATRTKANTKANTKRAPRARNANGTFVKSKAKAQAAPIADGAIVNRLPADQLEAIADLIMDKLTS